MTSPRLERSLAEVEQLLGAMAARLVSGDAPALQDEATALRDAIAALANAGRTEPTATLQQPAIRARLQAVSHALVRQRENLARRAVIHDRALAAVLPQQDVTYGSGRGGGFKGSVARIYAASAR